MCLVVAVVPLQPCRTLPRPNTPTSLLDSIFWVVSDSPSTAQLYTNSTGKVVAENGKAAENGAGQFHHNGIRYQDPLDEALGTEIYTKPLSRRCTKLLENQSSLLYVAIHSTITYSLLSRN
jgi:hypothetical protein